jgi:hypothetical protein
MRKWIYPLLLLALPVWALPGDLDLDGDVDFDDFFVFADNFGKTGAPDTLRVVVVDTLIGYKYTTIYDTTLVTMRDTIITEIESVVYDTVIVTDPIPGDFTTREQALSVFDPFDPMDMLRINQVWHSTELLRLGPGLERQEYGFLNVTYFEDGVRYAKTYLKPSGHLFEMDVRPYTAEVTFQGDGTVEFWLREDLNHTRTRYIFDADMNTADETVSEWWGGGGGDDYFYFTLLDDGTWGSEYASSDLEAARESSNYTYDPVDFDTELLE